nr:hypothetical protein [Rhizobium sp. R339]
MNDEEGASRRPIASRSSSRAIGLSAWLARTGVTRTLARSLERP